MNEEHLRRRFARQRQLNPPSPDLGSRALASLPPRSRGHRWLRRLSPAAVIAGGFAVLIATAMAITLTHGLPAQAPEPATIPSPRIGPVTGPSGLSGAAVAVDERRHEVLLFGGSRSRKATNETWVLAGGTWRQLHPALAPSPRVNASMAYDPVTRRLLLVGTYLPNGSGFLGGAMDSWSWDGTTWRQLHPTNDPDPDLYSAAVDTGRRQIVLHRGGAPLVATWTWDGTNWAQHPGAAGPAGFGGMSYDPLTGMVINVLFNPNGVDSSITWGWTGSTWREVTETQGLFTKGLLMAFDLPSHRLVAVNGPGCDAQGCSTETWLWDGRGWTRTAATHGPHNPGALVTDPASGSALLLGGPNQDDRYSQAWLWTGSDWARI